MSPGLQGCDQRLDLFGRLLGTLGQAAYFIGHHGESTTGLAGAGRLDRRVEGQQVGLLGHGGDHIEHTADLAAFLLQLVHGFA